jgi:oxidase EvaA
MLEFEIQKLFLTSALITENTLNNKDYFFNWINKRRESIKVEIKSVDFKDLSNWKFNEIDTNLKHTSNKFFSIEGVHIKTNYGNVREWTQPIINQPEIGFLGIITKTFNGVLYFLMQCKIEPGNINYVQLSPTLQATKSNYTKTHNGKSPPYLEYFIQKKNAIILMDQLQSEQGARFFKKRNRNIIIKINEDITVGDDFIWLTLGQIKDLMKYPNIVNMDTRSVLSGINFGNYSIMDLQKYFINSESNNFLFSTLKNGGEINNFVDIISWITNLKSKYELEVKLIPLKNVIGWGISKNEIFHKDRKYFTVIGVNVLISNREVTEWCQPLIKSSQEGIIAFLIKKINNVIHFLVQAKIEAGNYDILELAPTVQCLTGNYRSGKNEYEVPFIDLVLNAKKDNIIYSCMQSEEGGRFYKEQNLNMIVQVEDDFNEKLPEMYIWMTLNQIQAFIQFNNYFNIQARSLISAITF